MGVPQTTAGPRGEAWIDELIGNLYQLALARPAVARLIGLWITAALERIGR